MATARDVSLNDPHAPEENAIVAFTAVLPEIKHAILKSRHDWDKHEPRMWSRAAGLSNEQLVAFDLAKDLVEVRSGPTAYGTIVFGKIRIPAVNDEDGEGFVHVRIHDPPDSGTDDVVFHSIFTEESQRDADGHPHFYRAIHTRDTPLDFFVE